MKSFRNVAVPALGLFGFFFVMRFFFAYVPIYYEGLGFTPFQIGCLMAAFPLSSLFLSLPLGALSDRYTPKRFAVFGLLLFEIGLIFFGNLKGFYRLLSLIIVGGVGGALFRISCASIFYKSIGENSHGKKFGVINSGLMLGFGAGPFVGGYLLKHGGFEVFFSIGPFLLLPVVLISLFLVNTKTHKQNSFSLNQVLFRKEVIIFLLLIFLFCLHIGSEIVWFSLFLKDKIHLGEEMIGAVYKALVGGLALPRLFSPWEYSPAP